MNYTQDTIDEVSHIGIEQPLSLINFVDGSCGTHDDCKGHTGAGSSLGIGLMSSQSSKQKLVTRSSTECELVAVADRLLKTQEHKNFINSQGCKIQNILAQDNKSAIYLEQNGRISCSKRTKHVKIRYFSVKYLIERKEIDVTCCPTE